MLIIYSRWSLPLLFLIAFGSIFVGASGVNPQTTQVPFSGTVDGNCTFTLNQTGILGLSNNSRRFDSQIADGRPAELTIDCTLIGVQLQVEQPQQTLPLDYLLTDSPYNGNVSAEVNYQTFFFNSPSCSDTLIVNDTSLTDLSGCGFFSLGRNEITVNMTVTSDVVIPGGSYSYRVKLTAVP